MLPTEVYNACVYVPLALFFALGCYTGLRFREENKKLEDFLGAVRSQSALTLGINFFAASVGTWILTTLPDVATIAGLQGLIVYVIACVAPILLLSVLGPIIRRKNPDGFTLNQFIYKRFGRVEHLFVSIITIIYMAALLIGELSAAYQVFDMLTGINPLPVVIVVVILTSIYIAVGGFRASLMTDSFQGWIILALVIIGAITAGTSVKVTHENIVANPWVTQQTKIGWELLYILPAAVTGANLFHQGFWQRTFASRTDRDLLYAVVIGVTLMLPVLFLVGFTGILAAWAGVFPGPDPENPVPGYLTFFALFKLLPDWVVAMIVVLAASLMCCSVDTLQSALISTLSSDLFSNRVPLLGVRVICVVINVPIVILALKNVDLLQVFLVADLLACATIPPVMLGLSDRLFFLNGEDALIGGLGGLFSVFIFGWAYLGDALSGIRLLILPNGLYADNEEVLGAFLAAPVGAIVFCFISFGVRQAVRVLWSRVQGKPYEFPKNPAHLSMTLPRSDVGADPLSTHEGHYGACADEERAMNSKLAAEEGKKDVLPN
ncbi:uncharacterized protein VTP21DRAFT_624 [Calcarisporiella thermophila]|uniref:uncharacterized protein n=1 Tax=Calcarisporiella thermophila TaxID=911321 RepID=UPI003743D96C